MVIACSADGEGLVNGRRRHERHGRNGGYRLVDLAVTIRRAGDGPCVGGGIDWARFGRRPYLTNPVTEAGSSYPSFCPVGRWVGAGEAWVVRLKEGGRLVGVRRSGRTPGREAGPVQGMAPAPSAPARAMKGLGRGHGGVGTALCPTCGGRRARRSRACA